jgi:hypothetical protein
MTTATVPAVTSLAVNRPGTARLRGPGLEPARCRPVVDRPHAALWVRVTSGVGWDSLGNKRRWPQAMVTDHPDQPEQPEQPDQWRRSSPWRRLGRDGS